MKHSYALLLCAFVVTSATAASTTYNLDPDHTHPSFGNAGRGEVPDRGIQRKIH